jgi:argininosuccinate lyase
LTATVSPRVARLVYGSDTVSIPDLDLICTVDLAHLVMLAEQHLITPSQAGALAGRITALRQERFAPLAGLPAPRGTYLAYEAYLIQQLGLDTGGRLHCGRSRNDLTATTTALRLRAVSLELLAEIARLSAVLLARARAHRDVLMPVYTHFQAAMPATYGWYLLGVAFALERDALALQQALDCLDRCPLGAGAVAGTDLGIDASRTAELLGFSRPPRHALDAVASRDTALRMLAAAAGAALTVSRLAADLQLWSSAEFGLIEFPDRLVGGSSAMPQKRNAFLLEHLRARAGIAIGSWSAAATIIRAAPFTNSVEVGTEAVSAIWPGLSAVTDVVCLAQAVVSGAHPVAGRMRERAEQGFVGATALANRLVGAGVPFRRAHSLVGAAVRDAIARGDTQLRVSIAGSERHQPNGTDELYEIGDVDVVGDTADLDKLVAAATAGGGPGMFDQSWAEARAELIELIGRRQAVEHRVHQAERKLESAVAQLTGPRRSA